MCRYTFLEGVEHVGFLSNLSETNNYLCVIVAMYFLILFQVHAVLPDDHVFETNETHQMEVADDLFGDLRGEASIVNLLTAIRKRRDNLINGFRDFGGRRTENIFFHSARRIYWCFKILVDTLRITGLGVWFVVMIVFYTIIISLRSFK